MNSRRLLRRRQFLRLAACVGSGSALAACRLQSPLAATPALITPTAQPGLTLYVSPQGDDRWSGKLAEPNTAGSDGPFATLELARDAIRELKKASALPAGGVTVLIRAGAYSRSTTFQLTEEDSGTATAPIVYRAYAQEVVRITGGQEISGFAPVTDAAVRSRLDPAARDKVLQVDLKAHGISEFGRLRRRGFGRFVEASGLELFFQDKPMPLARWPNDGWATISSAPGGENSYTFSYDFDRPQRWAASDDIWVYGYWTYDWADSYERVAAIDKQAKVVKTAAVGPFGYTAGQRFYFLNVLEELDSPGEWFLDRATGLLYFWPPGPLDAGRVTVSLLEEPMVTLENVSYVTLQGLTLEYARGNGVLVSAGAHNRIAGCTLRNLGGVAVSIGKGVDNYASHIYENSAWNRDGGTDQGVLSCDIYHCGEGGIMLGGGDRKTLTPAGNYAVNNHFWNSNRIARTYRPAIAIDGVGNRAANNLIHDLPHFGIWLHGNDHILEYNEIYRVCLETNDAGAFYMGRDFTERGNVVRYNYFHDLGAGDLVQSVYLDDCASGTLMFGNIIDHGGRGVMVGGGRDNTIENNIFIEGRPAVHIDARGVGWAKFWFNGEEPVLMNRLKAVRHDQPPYSQRYPPLVNLLQDHPAIPKGNRVLRNIRVGGRWLDLLDGLDVKNIDMQDNLTDGDPGLVAPERKDFHLKPDSPALKLGFKPIPIEKIGLLKDDYRTTITRQASKTT
jgi:hypothetical protein